jgi:hypothetical protein
MYGIYNNTTNYTLVLINRSFTHTLRKIYIEIHRDEFTDEEYLISQYSPFHNKISHKFTPYNENLHWDSSKICITRNPYHRALSSFYLFCKKRVLTEHYLRTIRTPNIRAASILFDKNYKILNFVNFLKFLNEINPHDAHITTQTFNYQKFNKNLTLCKFGNIKTTLTDFYVNLGYTYDYIYPIIDMMSTIPFHSSGEKTIYADKRQYHLLSDVELFNMEFLPDIRNMLTPEIESLIYEYYKKDFEIFGYQRYNISE